MTRQLDPSEPRRNAERIDRVDRLTPGRAADCWLVGCGGATGSALRYVLGEASLLLGGAAASTMFVNVTGSALLGFLVELLARRGPDVGRRRVARLMLGVGLLGGYTTYSTFAIGTAHLVRDGREAFGAAYALVTVVAGVVAAGAGIAAARRIGFAR